MSRTRTNRVKLVPDRIKYWMCVGALPSEHVAVFIKKYMAVWEQKAAEKAAAAARRAARSGRPEHEAPRQPEAKQW